MEAEVRTGAISFFWIELFVMQRLTRTLLGVLMITLVLVSAAVAGPYEDGTAAQFNGDYATALRLWRPLADQGDTRAQYGVGSMYERGQGVPQNYAEAARWYHRAAELGDVSMQFDLGSMYHFGQVVSQNYTEAVRWYRRAADQGSIRAQNSLGEMYANGQGVAQNYVQAHMWFNLAAARANPTYQKETFDKAVHNRNLVAIKMTPAQVTEAQKLARDWKPKAER